MKISAVTYTTAYARVYGFVFERHPRSDFFVELCGMRARALAVHALARARGHSEVAPQSGQMSCGQ